ncbi:MAG: class I SAM-dependent methyltransferase [Chloroflexi bacterium]|nr:class I SAM-dependent methyltransferase [Chloroflexota bacterium]
MTAPSITTSPTGDRRSVDHSTTPTPDLRAIKARQQATWASGDYGHIGVRLQLVGELLCEAVDLDAGERVLDVAAGNGNASLAAARRDASVTSTDYVSALLEQGRWRADADRLPITFQVADAEALPFDDGSFDVALSVFGSMFAPDQDRTAAELLRVVRPGGRIGLASWTPEGFLGDLFRVIARFAPPPAGLRSPMLWGSEARIDELFAGHATDIRTSRRHFTFRFVSAEAFIELFRRWYGPIHRAFAAQDEAGAQAFHDAMASLLRSADRGTRGALAVPAEYLEVVVTRA